jgi:hypothetical protein
VRYDVTGLRSWLESLPAVKIGGLAAAVAGLTLIVHALRWLLEALGALVETLAGFLDKLERLLRRVRRFRRFLRSLRAADPRPASPHLTVELGERQPATTAMGADKDAHRVY